MTDANTGFGLEAVDEATADAKAMQVAALRAKAAAIVEATFDEEALLAQFVAEEQKKRVDSLHARASAAGDVADTPAESRGPEGTGQASAQGFPRKYVELMVFKGGQAQDLSYVPVSVNGYAWKIQRGVNVIVPSVVAETLEHAVEDLTVQSEGGLVTRPNHRFPFSVRREVTEPEYLAYVASQRALNKAGAVQRV